MAQQQLTAAAIVELVVRMRRVRALVDEHPQLKHVAEELLMMKGALPELESNGHVAPQSTTKKIHWTQRPENRAKVMKLAKKMQRGK